MAFNLGSYGVEASDLEMDAYAADIIMDMLMINGYESLDSITLSNGVAITNIENPAQSDKRMYFALNDSEIIGTLIVERIDNVYYSSFYLGAEEEICDAYMQNEAFSLYSYDGCLIMHTATDNQIIENDNFAELDADSINYPATALTRVYEKDRCISGSIETLGNSSTVNLLSASSGAYTVNDIYVPHVANGIAPDGKGMCWAASVASISNYRIGTNYTASSLYNRVWAVINGCSTENYPRGNAQWIGYAFAINNLEYTYEENALSGVRVSNILSADRPICMFLGRTDSNGVNHYHTVVLEGIYIGAKNFYLLVDSNVTNSTGNVVTVSVSNDALNNGAHFVNTTGTITYDNWRRTFY